MASVSGLSAPHRRKARDLAVQAAVLGYRNRAAVNYTQGPRRWDGINKHLKAWRGEFPRYVDCSSFVTWCIWNGLDHYGVRDTVNGTAWKAGYTGTMLKHGKAIHEWSNILKGDAVIYGRPGSVGAHTALCIGGGMVISHGSQAGPFLVPMTYRRDIQSVRRYI